MATDEGQRKLAAILAADVVGYSRLMADDERATVAALKEARAVFKERIDAHANDMAVVVVRTFQLSPAGADVVTRRQAEQK
jgi:class 3 adenylate cyclase